MDEAFLTAFDQMRINLRYRIWHYLRNHYDVEDLLQDTFIAAWQSWQVREVQPDNVEAWISTIARNRCIDLLRRRALIRFESLDEPVFEDLLLEIADPFDAFREMEEREDATRKQHALNAFMAGLSQKDRISFARRYEEHQSFASIAQELGTSQASVKMRLHRIKRKLQEQSPFACDEEAAS